ncbi:MAG: preprotein translocase subunit SecE [Parcubacteria group bacterium]|nr:preprotein translocase subunit SecE [Parcubacteria group bacterium]
MRRVFAFFREVREELAKVTWPSQRDTTRATLVVIGLSLALALFLGLLDYLLNRLITLVI